MHVCPNLLFGDMHIKDMKYCADIQRGEHAEELVAELGGCTQHAQRLVNKGLALHGSVRNGCDNMRRLRVIRSSVPRRYDLTAFANTLGRSGYARTIIGRLKSALPKWIIYGGSYGDVVRPTAAPRAGPKSRTQDYVPADGFQDLVVSEVCV